jgi:hypothetical protein
LVVVIGVTVAAAVIGDFKTVNESVGRDIIEISDEGFVGKSFDLAGWGFIEIADWSSDGIVGIVNFELVGCISDKHVVEDSLIVVVNWFKL